MQVLFPPCRVEIVRHAELLFYRQQRQVTQDLAKFASSPSQEIPAQSFLYVSDDRPERIHLGHVLVPRLTDEVDQFVFGEV